MLNDLKLLNDNKVYLRLESYNCCIVSKNNRFHTKSNLPFEVRLFIFDYASKRIPYKVNDVISAAYTYNTANDIKSIISSIVLNVIHEELQPNQSCSFLTNEKTDLCDQLIELCQHKMVDD